MYLRRVHLHGFKSFADRTEFEFGPGRTGIVGPNGCGKSNVLDAIRWVLGEQSAKTMRGTRMQDVIFSGSRSRKSANFAEVELTFDNSAGFLQTDTKEVSVGRVLYRSGESEYRLNSKPCRLKDIRELFLDTGVGVDAYSVIEQGRVALMLEANPQQRRELFEEAAGISRYRARRAEAQRKLERTQSNMLRLNDVLDEMEKRLRSVKLAAAKANKFQEYDLRVRELRSAFVLAEYHQLTIARRVLGSRLQAYQTLIAAQRAALGRNDAEVVSLERALLAQDETIHGLESRIRELESERSALDERVAQGRRRVDDLVVAGERRRSAAREAEERAALTVSQLGDEERAALELIETERRAAQRADELRTRLNGAQEQRRSAAAALERERAIAFDAARRVAQLSNEARNVEAQQRWIEGQILSLAERQARLDNDRFELSRRQEGIERNSAETELAVSDRGESLKAVEARVADIEARLADSQRLLNENQVRRSGLRSRLQLLEELERRLEGVERGPKWALQLRERNAASTVVGLVADVLRMDDPRVARLHGLLASLENHVVVRDPAAFVEEARAAGEAPGSVTAIGLNTADQPALPRLDAPGVVAHALDWVRCEAEYEPLSRRLLDDTLIVENIATALELAKTAPGYRFASLDGYVVRGGLVTVGAGGAGSGLISRRAEIRALYAEIDDVEAELQRGQRAKDELEQSLSDERLQRSAVLDELANLQRRRAELRNDSARANEDASRHEQEAATLTAESAALERSATALREQATALQSAISEAEQAAQTHEQRVTEFVEEARRCEAEAEAAARDLAEAQVEAGRAAERAHAAQGVLGELRQRIQRLRDETTRSQQEADEIAASIEQTNGEIASAEERSQIVSQELSLQQHSVLTARERRQYLRRRVEALHATAKRIGEEIDAVDAELRRLEVSHRETEVRAEALVARTRDELAVDLVAKHAEYQHTEQDWDAIRAEIDELRGKIARLGNVNLDAITELQELQPRFDEMSAQRRDLADSISKLDALIAELDNESQQRFALTFAEIRENYADLFRKLFGGGKADIILENPESPLDSGIEIIARPPGKEPKSISLLSGGERTMAAVALLFAVFKSRPSPFAILDEVDAALDEANIDRFNSVLNEFLTRSQFVLITHNKKTMQHSDVLYGVTMEEPGVSKRVSVRFESRVDTPALA